MQDYIEANHYYYTPFRAFYNIKLTFRENELRFNELEEMSRHLGYMPLPGSAKRGGWIRFGKKLDKLLKEGWHPYSFILLPPNVSVESFQQTS